MWVVVLSAALWCIPAISGVNHGGCYEDHRNRMLGEGKSGKFNDNSPSRCQRFCEEYKYYGVESEKECFCGNKIKYEEPKPQNKCNKKCPGKSIMCGGKWHLNVYINFNDFDKKLQEGACYSDHRARVLTGPSKKFDYNSKSTCNTFCQGYKYYAVESEKECFCGNTITKLFKRPNSECNKACPGKKSETCGGGWRMNIYRTKEAMNGKNWMKYLNGEKLLSAITLPGTHDTVATKVGLCSVGCVCQYRKITQQLEGGVRFVDIRLRHIENIFTIHHGPIYLQTEFGKILTEVTNFLRQNNQETVVMSYQEAFADSCKDEKCTRTYRETLKWYINMYSSYIYKNNTIPQLKDVRGKIVLLDFEGPSAGDGFGIRSSVGFSKSSTVANDFEPDCDPANFINGGSKCDAYFKSLKDNMEKSKTKGSDDSRFYITYTSANKIGTWLQGPFLYAKKFNYRVRDYLKGQYGNYGAVVMDFIFKGITPEIIYGTNFRDMELFNGGKTDGFPIALRSFPQPESKNIEEEETLDEEAME